MKKVDPNISEEELLRLVKEGKIFTDVETLFEMKAEKFVKDIVGNILDKDLLEAPKEIMDIDIDDRGNYIHIKFTGPVCTSTIVSIGQAFGDDNPNVTAVADNTILLDLINEKYDEIKY